MRQEQNLLQDGSEFLCAEMFTANALLFILDGMIEPNPGMHNRCIVAHIILLRSGKSIMGLVGCNSCSHPRLVSQPVADVFDFCLE